MAHARSAPALAWVISLAGAFTASGCFLLHSPNEAPAVAVDAGAASLDSGATLADAARPDASLDLASCDPADALVPACGPVCDGYRGAFWNGSECVDVSCACDGADCDALYPDARACEAAHARCIPAVCRATGGIWHPERAFCGSFECGHPAAEICLVGGPACDCGIGKRFDTATGCHDDTACGVVDLCLATGGASDSCNTTCGAPCPPPDPSDRRFGCNCGLGRTFDATSGCVSDPSCVVTDEALCAATGGSWSASCCPSTCGRPCAAACAGSACECGWREVWEPGRGCVESSACDQRYEGEACVLEPGTSPVSCAPGLLCCNRCTGIGCTGPVCIAPCCGDGCGTTPGCPDTRIAP